MEDWVNREVVRESTTKLKSYCSNVQNGNCKTESKDCDNVAGRGEMFTITDNGECDRNLKIL